MHEQPAPPPAIETDGVTKQFGDTVAVDDLDLRVDRGEVFGFLGPNGAGKSTTVALFAGFVNPTHGSVRVFGHDPRTEPIRVRKRLGVLPDDRGVYPNLTAREHLASLVRLTGAADDPDALLDTVGLSESARERPAGEYSTGMRGRLLLATALVGDPDLLVLDEPSLGLDPTGVAELRTLVCDLAANGTTVFLSSHRLSEVEAVCDRVGVFVDGRLEAVADVETLSERVGAGDRLHLATETPVDPDTAASVEAADGVADVSTGPPDTSSGSPVSTDGAISPSDSSPTSPLPPGVASDTADTTSRSGLTAVCTDPTVKATIVRRVDDRIGVSDMDVTRPSLETVFEAYTGGESDDRSPEGKSS
ncbi:ABC transporter ATP-binding protein [Halobaculum sp. MBLA0147]|uniref:ABC transporter ATP-binding protein n=1 Tax=Halobaculum sp. MBLA0147 TaxID=3079934 RepID=UPI0035268540